MKRYLLAGVTALALTSSAAFAQTADPGTNAVAGGAGGAAVGALIGCLVTLPIGCAPGALVGAAVGGGTGAVVGAASTPPAYYPPPAHPVRP